MAVDRFDYSTAIADSWKQQTLLNIVKLRYMDLPVFVDVASIVADLFHANRRQVSTARFPKMRCRATMPSIGGKPFTRISPPSPMPLTGEKFLRGLITPIDPKIFSSCYRPDIRRISSSPDRRSR